MAKALLGHVGVLPDYRMAAEVRRLELRIKELEAELAEVRSAHVPDPSVSPDLLELAEPVYS